MIPTNSVPLGTFNTNNVSHYLPSGTFFQVLTLWVLSPYKAYKNYRRRLFLKKRLSILATLKAESSTVIHLQDLNGIPFLVLSIPSTHSSFPLLRISQVSSITEGTISLSDLPSFLAKLRQSYCDSLL